MICPTLSSSVYLFVHVVICFFIFLSTYLSFCLFVHLSIEPSLWLSAYLSKYVYDNIYYASKGPFLLAGFQDLNDLSKYCNISIKILLAIPQKYLTLLTVLACKYLMLNVTQLHDGINHVVRL